MRVYLFFKYLHQLPLGILWAELVTSFGIGNSMESEVTIEEFVNSLGIGGNKILAFKIDLYQAGVDWGRSITISSQHLSSHFVILSESFRR